MPEEVVVHRETTYQGMQIPSDEEINRLFRLAKSFQLSGIYRDIKQAEAAFAKLIIGKDLGLTIAQSMQGVQFVQGQIQLHYSLLALVVRSRGYRWDTIERSPERAAARFFGPDLPEDGEVVEFTMEGDARRIGKEGSDMYIKFPTNMLWARMMSNAVRFVMPEATGGIPVYVPDEIPSERQIAEVSLEVEPIELPPEVEAVIARAESLGDPSNVIREVWQHHVDRGPKVLAAKVAEANAELDALERETITDAVVEPDVPIDTEGLPDSPAEADYVSPDPVGQEMGSLESPPEEPKLDREQLRKDLEAAQKKRPRTEDGRLQLQAEIECLQEDLAKAAKQAADEDPGQGTLI